MFLTHLLYNKRATLSLNRKKQPRKKFARYKYSQQFSAMMPYLFFYQSEMSSNGHAILLSHVSHGPVNCLGLSLKQKKNRAPNEIMKIKLNFMGKNIVRMLIIRINHPVLL